MADTTPKRYKVVCYESLYDIMTLSGGRFEAKEISEEEYQKGLKEAEQYS